MWFVITRLLKEDLSISLSNSMTSEKLGWRMKYHFFCLKCVIREKRRFCFSFLFSPFTRSLENTKWNMQYENNQESYFFMLRDVSFRWNSELGSYFHIAISLSAWQIGGNGYSLGKWLWTCNLYLLIIQKITADEHKEFFNSTLPAIIELALQLPIVCTQVMYRRLKNYIWLWIKFYVITPSRKSNQFVYRF